jgi:alpha-galactosidase
VFTGLSDHEGDEPWQFHRYLTEHRLAPFPHAVVFNSDGTDSNRISTGAKDDMDFATVRQVAPIARRLGVETFVLDDGWQAASGDWQPDSPQHPEPRGIYPPRFPDDTFTAVRAEIAPMQLGLWMSPVHFNPASETYKQHPEWGCTPIGQGTAIANLAQPGDGSNEAGIGQWSPAAFPYVESRIRDAIDNWGVRYFKFDFMVWLDCAGAGDLHDYHDAFLAMLDRLQRDHPEVTFQTDETNDYRLFPFESTARGPTWFQNGKPEPDLLLHNLWQLSPYVPASALGQHVLGGDAWKRHPVDTLMAAALPSHMTFISDIRHLPDEVVARAATWTAFYKAHREAFTQLVYPLLADPIADGWTALQSWNPDAGSGALLAFRQNSEEPAQTIRLENVPPGRRFRLISAPDGASAGTVSSKRLRKGLRIELPEKDSARVLVIEPASP